LSAASAASVCGMYVVGTLRPTLATGAY